jgi:transposase
LTRVIARATSLSRNTVRKYLRVEQVDEPRYRRAVAPTKLTPFHEAIVQALKADARRPKHERRTARALHGELKDAGYDGGYSRLTDFIRAWREGVGQALGMTAFVPLAFEFGEAFRFDWSEEGLVIGGMYRRVQLAHMKLCASRAFWLRPARRSKTFCSCGCMSAANWRTACRSSCRCSPATLVQFVLP